MPVVVKTATGQTLSFDVPLTNTVESLKSLVEASQAVPVAQQALFFQSTMLDNARALSEYGIADGAELQLTVSAGATAGGVAAGGASGAPQVSASLWVGDLDKAVTWQTLYEVFNPVAPVASIRVCRHHITHESLGYAYVNFHTAADADRVLNTMNYTLIAGRPCRVMWSERDASSRRSGKGNIFIKNLNPETIDVQVLHDTFSKFGNVQSCKVAMDSSGKHKGYGFVAFATDGEAQAAIDAVNGKRLDGYQVSVRKYVPRDQRQRTAEWNNVFVKDFPLTWTEETLTAEFGALGPIQSVYMPKDAEGNVSGTAFVCFVEHTAAKEAVAQLNGKPMSLTKDVVTTAEDGTETTSSVTVEKPLYVARAQKKDERKRELEASRAAQRAERNASLLNRNLYVRNLDESVTEEALQAAFEPHGAIESVRIAKDDKGRSKLFGYVCFVNQADAAEAEAAMNGHTLAGKPLAVLPWMPRAQRKQAQAAQQQQQPGWQRRQEPAAFGQGGRGGYGATPNPYMAAMQRGGAGGMSPQQMMYMQQMQAMMAAAGGRGGQQMNPQAMMQMMQMQMQMQRMMAAGAAQAHGMAPGQTMGQPQGGAPVAGGPPAAGPAAPTEQRSLAEVLAASNPEQRRQIIGTTLFQAVSAIQPDQQLARKITGMLLESTQGDTAEVLNLIESPADLRDNVAGAMSALQGAQ